MTAIEKTFCRLACVSALMASASLIQAQDSWTVLEQTTPTSADEVPWSATFYSAQNPFWPPLPFNLNGFSAWNLGVGVWLFDDFGFDYDAQSLAYSRFHPMGEIMVGEGTYNIPTYTTNDLWLEINTLTNGITGWTAGLTIHTPWNDTNLTHDLLYATDLNPPVNWRFLMRCPSTNVTAMYLCEPQGYFKLAQTNGALTVSTNWTAQQLAEMLVPSFVTVTNAIYTGAIEARGTFSGGNGCGLPLETGLILATGDINNAMGPNDSSSASTAFQMNGIYNGDPDLDALVGGNGTEDAAVLEFDVVSTNSFLLQIKYFFASEEYPEYCGSEYNDPMAIFVSTNFTGSYWANNITNDFALVPGTINTPVTVNTINGGYQSVYSAANPRYYVDNHDPEFSAAVPYAASAPEFNIQYDGMTGLLVAETFIFANVTNHVKIAIADYGDDVYDSAVFLAAAPIPCN